MARTYSNLVTSNATFGSWLSRTNSISTDFSETVTVKANTAGDMTTGNGFVTGIFGANTLTASLLKGGNVQSNASLSIVSNTELGNSSVNVTFVHNDVALTMASTVTTTNNDLQEIDSFLASSYRSGKYLISITDTVNNLYHATELMVMHDGTNAYVTEYASLISDYTLGTISTDINSGSVRILITPVNDDNEIKIHRTLMTV